MKFQIALPILLKSFRSFDLEKSTCLLVIYLAIKFRKFFIFLASNAICSIKLWREMEWKLPLQSSSSVGTWGLYGSWMLIILLFLKYVVGPHVGMGCWSLLRTHWGLKMDALRLSCLDLVLSCCSAILLTQSAFF